MLQVVVPMAGLGTRFTQYGFRTNKCLLPVNLQLDSMIELSVVSLGISVPCKYFFIINEENGVDDLLRTTLKSVCEKHQFSYEIASVTTLTEGPASTVATIEHLLNPDAPLLVSNSDQVLDWSFDEFYKSCVQCDGCVLTYTPEYMKVEYKLGSTDKHSFVQLDNTGTAVRFAEKIVLSDKALVGVHYYRQTSLFFDSYNYLVKHQIRAPNGEFYLSLTYQALLEIGSVKLGYHDLIGDYKFYPVGEPDDYFNYLYGKGGYIHQVNPISEHSLDIGEYGVINYKSVVAGDLVVNSGFIVVVSGSVTSVNKLVEPLIEIVTGDVHIITDAELMIITVNTNVNLEPSIYKLGNFVRGWFIGDFEPTVIRTRDYEIAVINHKKDEQWDYHYHKEATEMNVLLKGSMLVNNRLIKEKHTFVIQKNQLTCPIFLEDCFVLCVKIPSIPKDKYSV